MTVKIVKPKKSNEEGSNDWRDFAVVNVRLRPGSAKPYWEGKLQFADGTERRAVMNFVTYFNDLEDQPRRRERKYPLD
jgi:hypothetical protein